MKLPQSGNITQVFRKYGIGYSLFYKWKHRDIAEGINGLESRNRNSSNSRIGIYSSKEIDLMQSENQRLKKIVAEKELQIEMLQEIIKKEDWKQEDLVNLTLSYNNRGLSINKGLKTIMLAKSSYYKLIKQINSTDDSLKSDLNDKINKTIEGGRGRKISSFTKEIIHENNKEIIISLPDTTVKNDIQELLSKEFVCYGYKKVAKFLKKYLGYIINSKKVYRLMKEMSLLLPKIRPTSIDIMRVKNRKIHLSSTKRTLAD